MTYSVRYHPSVPRDIAEALMWYERVSLDLANRLRRAIASALAEMRCQPLLHGIAFDDVRVIRVRDFPYLVQYQVQGETVRVLGVFHSASNPDKWLKRAGEESD